MMESIVKKPQLLDSKSAADFLGVSAGTLAVWRSCARYPLKYIKIGRSVRYDVNDLLAWMESRKVHQAEVR